MVFRYKMTFQSCNDSISWNCEDCEIITLVVDTVFSESSGQWCQREGVLTVLPRSDPMILRSVIQRTHCPRVFDLFSCNEG